MLKKLLQPGNHTGNTNIALLLFRVGLGLMMLTHGYPKLQRLLAGEFQFGDPLGLSPEVSLVMAVLAEFVGSLLIIFGLATRIAVLPLIGTMAVAWIFVHGDDPFGTQEKAVLYLLCFIVLFITGAGNLSMDKRLFDK